MAGNTVPNGVPGVFYNYGANVLSTNDPMFNAANSATPTATITLEPSFGATYVAWTAPDTGMAAINMSAWDTGYNNSTNDGVPSLYVITSLGGPTAPIMFAYNLANVGNGNQVGGRNTPWSSANNYGSTVGTVSLISQLPAYTAALGYQLGIGWTANVPVTAGEVLYFVADADHTNGNEIVRGFAGPRRAGAHHRGYSGTYELGALRSWRDWSLCGCLEAAPGRLTGCYGDCMVSS